MDGLIVVPLPSLLAFDSKNDLRERYSCIAWDGNFICGVLLRERDCGRMSRGGGQPFADFFWECGPFPVPIYFGAKLSKEKHGFLHGIGILIYMGIVWRKQNEEG